MNPIRKVNFALRLLAQGQTREAAELSALLLKESPEVAEVHALACELASVQERGQDALEHIERSIQLEPERHDFRLRKAGIQLVLRQGRAAQATAAELAALSPDDPDLQLAVARIFADCGNHAGAAKYLEAVAAEHRASPEFLSRYATNQFFLGNIETAEQAVADYLALNPPRPGLKLLLRSTMRKQTSGRNHVDELRNYLDGSPPPAQAVNAYFALAKELEDLGEYPQSFEALRSGAALQRQLVRYDPAGELANIRGIAEAFRAEAFAAIPDSGATETPVFIVGLPRTGTTLVERLLTRNGEVRPSEENYDFTLAFSSVINEHIAAQPGRGLTPLTAALEADFGEIARRYLANMQGMLGEADRYLDKTPFNYLYCGLIRKAFPQARIIHLVRDPMDACYAVFKTLFSRAYYYSYDLDELAAYYVAYRELMDHWRGLMPGVILDVRYEALVTDPEAESRRIAEFVGIPWSRDLVEIQDSTAPCATASAAQVRQPIYTSSIGLWRNVAAPMEPVRLHLAAAGLVDENGDPAAPGPD
jgi:tetratricopeptide (TPR) repeat protein